MTPVKTALAASVILSSLGLAGCQTTEERVYYSAPAAVRTTYVYTESPYVYRRPAAVYVAPTPRYVRPPVRYVRPVAYPPRYYGGTTPYPRAQRVIRPMQGGRSGYDTQ